MGGRRCSPRTAAPTSLFLLTAVEHVAINFSGKPDQRSSRLTAEEAERLADEARL